MAWSIVQSSEGTSTSATVTATLPSAPTSGNLIVLAFAADDYNGTPNTGWTQSTGMEQQTEHGGYLWWRVSDGSNSFQYTIGSGTNSSWVLVEISGASATPYDISNGQCATGSASAYTTPSITPSSGSRLLVAMFGASSSSGDMSADLTTWTNSFTHIRSSGPVSATGTRDGLGVGFREITGDGATTFSAGASFPYSVLSKSGLIIAFKAGAAGGGISGSASITEAADTVSSAAALAITGTTSATEASDTVAATGAVAIKADLAATEASDTVAATATLAIAGSVSASEAGDTVSATAALAIAATLSVTEAADTVTATGAGSIVNTGSASLTEAADTVVATATLTLAAVLSATEAQDTVSAAATIAIRGAVAAQEASDTLTATGGVLIKASVSATEAGDTVTAVGRFLIPSAPSRERILVVPAENRVFAVEAENRVFVVPAESRVFTVEAEQRSAAA